MYKVEWKTATTSQKIGSKTIEEGGKKKVKVITSDVSFDYPIISGAESYDDLASALREIVSSGKQGFSTFELVTSHLNYGNYRHLAVMYNSGQDATLTPHQREAVKTLASLVKGGVMPLAEAVKYASAQGIENASDHIEAFLAIG